MAVQPRMLQAEQIGDVEEGAAPDVSGLDEYGFTPEERAVFDGMKEGETDSSGPADPEPAADPEPDPTTVDPLAPVAPPAAEDDDDAPDVITTDPKTGKTQKTINYGKHQRLITKAQKEAETLRVAAETERLNNAKLAERLQILNEALMAPSPQAADPAAPAAPANPMLEPTINVEDDAIAAVAQMQRRQIWLANSSTQAQEQTQEMLEDQQLVADFTRETNAFSSTEEGKHFLGAEGAYQYLKNSRLIDLGISLFDKDPTDPAAIFTQAEINQMISTYNADEKWVVSNALKQNKSPSQAIMKLAKGRGWRPPAAAAAAPAAVVPPAAVARAPAAGARPAPAPAAAPSSAVAKLQSEIAGAAASRSLSDGGGSPPAEPLTAESLLRMNDEEFGRYVDSLPKDRLDSIMGKQFPGR